MARLSISEQDGSPIYLQIVNQIKLMVSSGRLKADEELPSIRALAEQLVVNPNTVARAYRELEVAGIVCKKRATGCYVSPDAGAIGKEERLALIGDRVDALIAQAAQLGISLKELTDYLHSRNNQNEVSLP